MKKRAIWKKAAVLLLSSFMLLGIVPVSAETVHSEKISERLQKQLSDIANMSFVIENGELKEELCAEHIVIEKYDDLLEYNSATHRVNDENWKYAPDSYNHIDRPFVSNCVILRVNTDASFSVDAEHIVTIIQYTKNNSFYIQYDSEEAAGEAAKVLNKVDGIKYAGQNSYFSADEEEPNSIPFKDVSETDWFYSAVEALYNEEIMIGPEPNIFSPYEYLRRAQFVVILYRMEEEPKFETEKNFSDITGDEWYGPATLWAAENMIVTGYENGCYGPIDNITREQMAVMLYRYAKYKGYDTRQRADLEDYPDASRVSDFAKDAVSWCVANDIISGSNGKLLPQGNTNRAEGAVMIFRFQEKFK